MRSVTMRRVTAAALLALLAASGTAAAQGRGGGRGRQIVQGPRARSGGGQTSTADVTIQPASFPQFGTWLDDATIATPGAGYGSIGMTYWRASDTRQVDAPILGVTYGVANRAQLSATVPFYRVSYDGFSGSGLDNVYLSTKVAIVNPDAGPGRIGIAIGAAAEIVSAGYADASRLHWALPLSVELRASPVRLYGSTGYFSRGAFFVAGAAEWTMPTLTSVTASLAHSASVHAVTVATAATMPSGTLREATVFVSQPVSSVASVHVGGSRTFSSTTITGAFSASAGFSFRFAGS